MTVKTVAQWRKEICRFTDDVLNVRLANTDDEEEIEAIEDELEVRELARVEEWYAPPS